MSDREVIARWGQGSIRWKLEGEPVPMDDLGVRYKNLKAFVMKAGDDGAGSHSWMPADDMLESPEAVFVNV